MKDGLKAPFPYFGGKRKIAGEIWNRFGDVANYVEPFCGSCAVLLMRPTEPQTETVNDADGLLSNFWRSLKYAPDETTEHADWPVSECDLHARHAWLVGKKDSLQARLEGDPEFYDAKIAGWWVWGISCWIGAGWCSGNGPWQVREVEGVRKLVHVGDEGRGVNRKLVHVGDEGRGVNRQLVHVGDEGRGVNRQLVHVGNEGQGVNRKRERLTGFAETGVNAIGVEHKRPVISGPAGGNAALPPNPDLTAYFRVLAKRLRRVRVCCGDWRRVCGPSVTFGHGVTGVFLDPPYADTANRTSNLYRVDCEQISHDVRDWAVEQGNNPLMRIALCGYEGEHFMPDDWVKVAWKNGDGYGGRAKNRSNNGARERIWFSPACKKSSERLLKI